MPENSRLVARTVNTEETRVSLDCRTEAAALGRMLKNATLFANASTITESGLDVIRLEVRPGELSMFATDRYVLAQETTRLAPHDAATPVQAGTFTLGVANAKTLTKALPRTCWTPAVLTVTETHRSRMHTESGPGDVSLRNTTTHRRLTVQIHRRSEAFTLEFTEPDPTEMALTYKHYQRKLRAHEPGEARSVTFSHRRISKLGRVRTEEPDAALELVHGTDPDQPVKIRIGNRFEALIMPARPPAATRAAASSAATTGTTTTGTASSNAETAARRLRAA